MDEHVDPLKESATWGAELPNGRLLDLVAACCDSAATPATWRELDALLRSDRAALRYYIAHLQLHARLGKAGRAAKNSAAQSSATSAAQRSTARKGGALLDVGNAAPAEHEHAAPPFRAVLPAPELPRTLLGRINQPTPFSLISATSFLFAILTLLAIWQLPRATEQTADRSAAPPTAVATDTDWIADFTEPWDQAAMVVMTGAHNCKFTPPIDSPDDSPHVLALDRGVAKLSFRSGAQVTLAGPAQFSPRSEQSGYLQHGRLTARATGSAVGFTIETPTVRVVDLGTQFAVVVAPDGATDVHVLEGSVRIEPARASSAHWQSVVLAAGDSRRIIEQRGELSLLPATYTPDDFPADAPTKKPDLTLASNREDATIMRSYAASADIGGLRVGGRRREGGTRAVVLPFRLPRLPAGVRVARATLVFSLQKVDETDPIDFAIDLYSLPPRERAQVQSADAFYAGPTGGDPSASLVAADVLTLGAQLGRYRIDRPELTAYVNAHLIGQDEQPKFLFLRFSPTKEAPKDAAFHIASSEHPDSARRPWLELTFEASRKAEE